jgi:hypothetical protein
MLKIICDRCSKPCDGTHGRLNLTRAQHASSGEVVASDDFKGLDLCDICTEVARSEWGFKVSQDMYKPEVMEFTAPQPELPGYTVVLGGGGGAGASLGPARGGPVHLDSEGDRHIPPDDDSPPRTLVVGMVVDRAIATRWNLRNFGTGAGDEPQLDLIPDSAP